MDYDKEAVKRKLAELQSMMGTDPSMMDTTHDGPETEAQDLEEDKKEVKSGEMAPSRGADSVETQSDGGAPMDSKIMEMMAAKAPHGRGPIGLQEKAAQAQKDKMHSMKK